MQTVLKIIFSGLLGFIVFTGQCQTEDPSSQKSLDVGLEIQVYPTGIIPGIRLEKYINSNVSINFRLGYQLIDHRDLGVQDNEEGSGYGASLAYRKFFKEDYQGLSLGIRTDLWFNTIDWTNDMVEGITDITVIQPTLMGEYAFKVSNSMVITPSLSFGWEWNVSTDGEPTGEGAILLIGCMFGFGI